MTRHPLCRFCESPLTETFADLGHTPLANAFLTRTDLTRPEPTYPLHARVCSRCFLVQIEAVVKPEELFSDYIYYSGYSTSWLEHCQALAEQSARAFDLGRDSLVVEVASNDGCLLKYFKDMGITVLGIEPAENIASEANAAGIPTRASFFGLELAQVLVDEGIRPDLLIGNNVLAHVPDLNDFVSGLAFLIGSNGVVSLEFPHLLNLIQEVQFDTIYHEHFSYFSFLTVEQVFDAHGLHVFDVARIPTHGGSLRILAESKEGSRKAPSSEVAALRRLEKSAGLDRMPTYRRFSDTVRQSTQLLRSFLDQARADGRSVVGYGAAAKGNTLLNTVGAGTDEISYSVDRNPKKQGLYLPGSHIPVCSPDRIFETRPDFLLILPWNLTDEIVEDMEGIRAWGGQFVVPIPEVEVLP